MAGLTVLEIGPGIRPSRYAFDPTVTYTGVDPDMRGFAEFHLQSFMSSVEAQRGTLENFEYRRGKLAGDLLTSMANTQDIVVMANVLGDPYACKGVHGYFLDPEVNKTRITDIKVPSQLIAQAMQFLKAEGTLIVVEDFVDRDGEVEHVVPEEFEQFMREPEIQTLTGHYKTLRGRDYLIKMEDLGLEAVAPEQPPDYMDTCFAAEVVRTA